MKKRKFSPRENKVSHLYVWKTIWWGVLYPVRTVLIDVFEKVLYNVDIAKNSLAVRYFQYRYYYQRKIFYAWKAWKIGPIHMVWTPSEFIRPLKGSLFVLIFSWHSYKVITLRKYSVFNDDLCMHFTINRNLYFEFYILWK